MVRLAGVSASAIESGSAVLRTPPTILADELVSVVVTHFWLGLSPGLGCRLRGVMLRGGMPPQLGGRLPASLPDRCPAQLLVTGITGLGRTCWPGMAPAFNQLSTHRLRCWPSTVPYNGRCHSRATWGHPSPAKRARPQAGLSKQPWSLNRAQSAWFNDLDKAHR
jgi:hypothetical protein